VIFGLSVAANIYPGRNLSWRRCLEGLRLSLM
jgi:hypothetical protein